MINPFVSSVQAAVPKTRAEILGQHEKELVQSIIDNPDQGDQLKVPHATPSSRTKDLLQAFGIKGRGANRFVEGLFGGTERTAMGAADYIPGVGQALAANRSGEKFGRGDLKGGMLEALGAFPGGIKPRPKPPPGTQLETVMLSKGQTPRYGIVDKHDNSLPTTFGGHVSGQDLNMTVENSIDWRMVDELLEQVDPRTGKNIITKNQAYDATEGPRLPHPTDEEFVDQLLLRGLKPGDAVKSGTAFGNTRGILKAAQEASLTEPLEDLQGVFRGGRVTGAKSRGEGSKEQRISIPKQRAKAIRKGMKPARDLTISGQNNPFQRASSKTRPDIKLLEQVGDIAARRAEEKGMSVGARRLGVTQDTPMNKSLIPAKNEGIDPNATPFDEPSEQFARANLGEPIDTPRQRSLGDRIGDALERQTGRPNSGILDDDIPGLGVEGATDLPIQVLARRTYAQGGDIQDIGEHTLGYNEEILRAEISWLDRLLIGVSDMMPSRRAAINELIDARRSRLNYIQDDEIPF